MTTNKGAPTMITTAIGPATVTIAGTLSAAYPGSPRPGATPFGCSVLP